MGAPDIDLRAMKDKDVFIPLMDVLWDVRPRRVLQDGRRWAALAVPVKTMNVYPWPIGRPCEIWTEDSTREF